MPTKKPIEKNDYYSFFPSRLRDALSKNQMTQKELAGKIEKSRQTVSTYCDGSATPDIETALCISQALNVSINWLLGIEDSSNTSSKVDLCINTGLSANAIDRLQHAMAWQRSKSFDEREMIRPVDILSFLLERDDFWQILYNMSQLSSPYLKRQMESYEFAYDFTDDDGNPLKKYLYSDTEWSLRKASVGIHFDKLLDEIIEMGFKGDSNG